MTQVLAQLWRGERLLALITYHGNSHPAWSTATLIGIPRYSGPFGSRMMDNTYPDSDLALSVAL